jgi:hypothetical protein
MKAKPKFVALLLCGLFMLAFLVAPALASPPDLDPTPASAVDAADQAVEPVAESEGVPGGVISIVAGLAALLFAVGPGVKDALLKATTALPDGAATVYSTGIDTGVTPSGMQPTEVEWVLSVPAMNVTEMPNAKTMTYSIMTDTVAPIDGSSTALMPSVIVQTGAGGVGCAADEYRFKLPSNAGRIIGVRAVGSASGDATTASFTLEPVF